MGRKKVVPLTAQQITDINKQKALDSFYTFNRTSTSVIPKPTREFSIGNSVVIGNRTTCVVVDVLEQGKAYLVEMDPPALRDAQIDTQVRDYMAKWWFDVNHVGAYNPTADNKFLPFDGVHLTRSDLYGVFHRMDNGGIVCDPRFQRGYVWGEDDRTALLDSVFERLELGSIVIMNHHGYLHDNDPSSNQYITLDGRAVEVLRRNDYTASLIDGQQRLTTLYNFYTNRWQYRGVWFSDLSFSDQHHFLDTSISVRMFDEDKVTFKQVVKIFLQVNRGVPQTREHLAKIQALYDAQP